MGARFTKERDPIGWCALLCAAFLGLVLWRLSIPTTIYFDEVHYLEAARKQLEGLRFNPEHPIFGKTLIALAIEIGGDRSLSWRLPSAMLGTMGLFAFSRLCWWISGRRTATIAATFLLATNFAWFVMSRIAMLDMTMAAFAIIGLWLFASAIRRPEQGRWRLMLSGIALGLSLGAKWSAASLLPLPGLVFLIWKLRDTGARFLVARDGGAVPGIGLAEAALWLGSVPLAVYWATFWPGFLWHPNPIDPWHPIAWHRHMLELQESVKKLHQYRSVWYEWIVNWRPVWLLYQPVDGAQRGILMLGNPFTMLAGLPAVLWSIWAGWRHRRHDMAIFAALYVAALSMWIVAPKPVQFYFHYLLPSTFLMACLALALEALWQRGDRWRWIMPVSLLTSAGMFAHFYPILSAAELCCGRPSFAYWMWLDSWR